jgi:hypothetical protein
MTRANSLVFGKIQIHSDYAKLTELQEVLTSVIEKHGYPEKKIDVDGDDPDKEFEEFEDELKTEGEKEMEQDQESFQFKPKE